MDPETPPVDRLEYLSERYPLFRALYAEEIERGKVDLFMLEFRNTLRKYLMLGIVLCPLVFVMLLWSAITDANWTALMYLAPVGGSLASMIMTYRRMHKQRR